MTDTAREADIILPAKTMFEQSDVIGAYWHPYIQLKQKMLEPPGEVKPESEIYYLLARRLGFAGADIATTIPEPSDEANEAFLREKLAPFPELTLERLREKPIRGTRRSLFPISNLPRLREKLNCTLKKQNNAGISIHCQLTMSHRNQFAGYRRKPKNIHYTL
jgi:anaerobic selenocysteine-containing dehydrogenase